MAGTSPERLRNDLSRLLNRAHGVREFTLDAARMLARAVPFDGVCMLTMDPATRLPTGEVVENALPAHAAARMAEIEFRGQDVNSFDALARSGRGVATLSAATGGELNRSERHQELRAVNGFGDELRALATVGSATWGALTLLRRPDRGPFSTADTALLASLSKHLGEGLRRATLLTALAPGRRDRDEPAGLVLLAGDGSIAQADVAAEMWLARLREDGRDGPLPGVVAATASRARSIAQGRAPEGAVARARVSTASGSWLVLRGSMLGDGPDAQAAVIVEPARTHELAPLIADAYGLTERERTVTQLVAQGLPTDVIAGRLHISPWTVQDHLKAIFDKTGVGTRGELISRMFFDHYAPRLTN